MESKAGRRRAYDKGVWSEDFVAEYLVKRRYKILERRYKTKFGEIDIVALKGDCLIFVEVKARRSFSEGAEAVHFRARRRIEQAALYFMAMHEDYGACGMRFDVAVISSPVSGSVSIDYLDNAWEAGQ